MGSRLGYRPRMSKSGQPEPETETRPAACDDLPPPDYVGTRRRQPWNEDLDPYDRASVAVDGIVLTIRRKRLHLVLWRRDREPQKDRWALPGGMVHWPEEPTQALRRALKEKVGLGLDTEPVLVQPVNDFDRDPRGWILTLAYLVPVPSEELKLLPTMAVAVVPLDPSANEDRLVEIPDDWRAERLGPSRFTGPLAFGHHLVLREMLRLLRRWIRTTDIGLRFMPERFTMRELQDVHEAILGHSVNRANFRRIAVETQGWTRPTGDFLEGHGQRRTELFERAPGV